MFKIKTFIKALAITALLIQWGGVMAQDQISNGNNGNFFGLYTGPNENVVINNEPFFTGGSNNFPGGEFNFVGGSINTLSPNGNLVNSLAYGANNNLSSPNPGGIAIGLGEQHDLNFGSNYALGEKITINSPEAVGIGVDHIIDQGNSVAIGEEHRLNNPDNYGFGREVTVSADNAMAIGLEVTNNIANSITMGLDNSNMLNLFLDGNGNPVVGINRTSVSTANQGTGIDLTVQGGAENGTGSWITRSDRRLKKNIKPFEDGLEKILKIKPKWYQYNDKIGYSDENKHVGIIAQEMQKVAPYMINDNGDGYLGYNPNALRYLLVNAVQEQQKAIEKEKQQRKEKIEQLEERIADLEAKMQANHGSGDAAPQVKPENQKTVKLTNENIDDPILYQNVPNPFRDETVIKYYLPENSQNGELLIASAREGTVLKRISLENSGKGQVNLQTDNLKTGTYTYTLLVNGEQVESRKMVIKP